MAYLEQFVPVKSFLTYFYVRSGTFTVQTTLFKPFSNLLVKMSLRTEWSNLGKIVMLSGALA